jgi:hypothetical protein
MEEQLKTKKEIWTEIIKAWEASGLSQRKYCSQKGLVTNTFLYWRKRLKKIENKSSFVRLPASKKSLTAKFQLYIKEGVKISFNKSADIQLLMRIIEVIDKEL